MLQIKNVFVTPSNEKKAAVCFFKFLHKKKRFGNWTCYVYSEFYSQARAKLKFSVYEGDHLTLLNVYQSFLKVV